MESPPDEGADHEVGAAEDNELGAADGTDDVQTGVEELGAATGVEIGGEDGEQAPEEVPLLAHAQRAFAALCTSNASVIPQALTTQDVASLVRVAKVDGTHWQA